MVCFRLKRHVLNCFIFSDYDSLRDVRKINTNLLYTLTILIICKERKLNINIASILITLTEINNETHYVVKKKTTKKQAKTAPIGFALS
jgi:hypothetical protein